MTPDPQPTTHAERSGRRFTRRAWYWTVAWRPENPDHVYGWAVSGWARTRIGASLAARKEARQ